MATLFRTKKQRVAWLMLAIFVGNMSVPLTSNALTSGPSQPELQGFQPAGTSDMVDLFSGDFSYNIPLFELPGPNGGYPFNLSYQSGVTMDQEASWVGLGWSLNPGSINRQMRGLPDDFKGDKVLTKVDIEPNITVGVGVGAGLEVFGAANDVGNVGLSFFYNNYKGFGYSVDASVGFTTAMQSGMTNGIRLGANISLNSQEGASIAPSLSLGSKIGDFGVSTSYNARNGLDRVSLSHTYNLFSAPRAGDTHKREGVDASSSASLSLANPGYTPQISMPMSNFSVSARFNTGGALLAVFGKGYLKGFYSEQRVKNFDANVESLGYGYMNYDEGFKNPLAVMDFNREKDGMVTKETPNLGIPSLTYDIYSVTGQGIGAMYRPVRNDIGIVRDAESVSESSGGALGIDAAPGLAHVGINLAVNYAKSVAGGWNENNDMWNNTFFQPQEPNDLFEPWNFKVHGEMTGENMDVLNSVGGTSPMRVVLDGTDNPKATTTIETNDRTRKEIKPNIEQDRTRKQRNDLIQTFTNEQIRKPGSTETLLNYFSNNSYFKDPGVVYPRTATPSEFTRPVAEYADNHIAGFTALNTSGLRYNYTIPVYNHVHEEYQFSTPALTRIPNRATVAITPKTTNQTNGDPFYKHPGTDKYLKKVSIPMYAYSYLLTSIVGPDYVDIAPAGLDENDLGYWVKFTYQQTTAQGDRYKWRDPIKGAHLSEGWITDLKDDRASFTYGEKDLWYLVRAETKTHVAVFDLNDQNDPNDKRDDGRGVFSRLQQYPLHGDTDDKGKRVRRLKGIGLYSRAELKRFASDPGEPLFAIKKVEFEYYAPGESLCQAAPNSGATPGSGSGGKLTLKKVQFKYGTSNRQSKHLNPYVFSYETDTPYVPGAYDRWGNYRGCIGDDCLNNLYHPYSDQVQSGQINTYAAEWSMTKIQTPSGSTIFVDYESDDYAYVQHKPAMEMVPLVSPNAGQGGSTNDFMLDPTTTKVRFLLSKPVATGTSQQERDKIMRSYIGDRDQVYFKLYINLKTPAENMFEYINGYAAIDPGSLQMEAENGAYRYGTFNLKPDGIYHPFAKRAWQHLRTNQPDLIRQKEDLDGGQVGFIDLLNDPAGEEKKKLKNILRDLSGEKIWSEVKDVFKNYDQRCNERLWGQEIRPTKSFLRLGSVDKIKYGGGVRVFQITVKDNWQDDKDGVYGQLYDYRTKDTDGITDISSGVASYEPMVGGDENSLHYAKMYTNSVPMRSDNNLFFEFPVNEGYYPGPQVGYRKVTVTSLPAAALTGRIFKQNNVGVDEGPGFPSIGAPTPPGGGPGGPPNPDDPDNRQLFPTGFGFATIGTTGRTVHEFYTAKDFPVISEETDKFDEPDYWPIPIPFLGHVSTSRLTSTQGYSIITNDMHGKPYKVSNYRQEPTGVFEADPISSVEYIYAADTIIYQKEKVSSLRNGFKQDSDGTLSLASAPSEAKYSMGQENEFFLDMRQYEDVAWEGGFAANTDIIALPFFPGIIPVPTIWPSIGKTTTTLRTAVTNKVIFRPGILETVIAYDGGSRIKTESIKWDKLTGQVVLSKVNNNFDKPVYTHSVPAYTQYRGLSGAYQNAGTKLKVGLFKSGDDYLITSGVGNNILFPGDEIVLIKNVAEGQPAFAGRVIYMGVRGFFRLLSPSVAGTNLGLGDKEFGSYSGYIARSGYRNHLGATAGTTTGLEDPSAPATAPPGNFTKVVTVPTNP